MKKNEILGPGCPKCNALSENVKKALQEMNQAAEVVKITDIKEMIAKGVMMTPGLAIDGKIISQGNTLSVEQIKELIKGKLT
jgi:small redox-active disulfide protein 2